MPTLKATIADILRDDRNLIVDEFRECGLYDEKVAGEVISDGVAYRFVVDSLAGTLRLDRVTSTQFDQYLVDRECSKGYTCGASCITRSKACLRNLTADQKKAVKALKGKARVALSQQLQAENAEAASGGNQGDVDSLKLEDFEVAELGQIIANPESSPDAVEAAKRTLQQAGILPTDEEAEASRREAEKFARSLNESDDPEEDSESESDDEGDDTEQTELSSGEAPTATETGDFSNIGAGILDPENAPDAVLSHIAEVRQRLSALPEERQAELLASIEKLRTEDDALDFRTGADISNRTVEGLLDRRKEELLGFDDEDRKAWEEDPENVSLREMVAEELGTTEKELEQFGDLQDASNWENAINNGANPDGVRNAIAQDKNRIAQIFWATQLDRVSEQVSSDTYAETIKARNPDTSIQKTENLQQFNEHSGVKFTIDTGEVFYGNPTEIRPNVDTINTANTAWRVDPSALDPEIGGFVTASDAYEAAATYSLNLNSSVLLQYPVIGENEDLQNSTDNLDSAVQGMRDVVRQSGGEGGTVVFVGNTPRQIAIAEALGLSNENKISELDELSVGVPRRHTSVFTGIIRNGQIEPIDLDGTLEADVSAVRRGRDSQFRRNAGRGSDGFGRESDTQKQELATMRQYADAEDRLLGRNPSSRVPSQKTWENRAEQWSRETFGEFDEGANGFSLAQTKAHDVAHPITHELTGLNSDGIRNRFGGFSNVDGNNSLVAEEAVVNIVEHLSRGDSVEASLLNGVRLAKVLSRSSNTTAEESRYFRSNAFKDDLRQLTNQIYRHNNFSRLMQVVMKSNRTAGTVTVAGDDFTNSASGG